MSPDTSPVLTIGALLGDADAESLAWAGEIQQLSLRVSSLATGVWSPVRLGLEFHVDGRIEPNTFVGVRTGRFSRARSHLVVQAALPKVPVDDPRTTLIGLLDEAVAEAERFLTVKGAADGLPELRRLVARL